MFRDESTKVMQKAHAQWGGEEPEAGSSASVTSSEPSQSAISHGNTTSTLGTSPTSGSSHYVLVPQSPSINTLGPSLEEQAVNFYINRYIIGHPDEPRNADELADIPWIWSPLLNDAMVAVGLAGLSNLRADRELMNIARHRYGKALRQTGQLLGSNVAPSHEAMRLVVMLAIFEV
jgi:hypothetical protein